jgi:hypothetical protein
MQINLRCGKDSSVNEALNGLLPLQTIRVERRLSARDSALRRKCKWHVEGSDEPLNDADKPSLWRKFLGK